MGPMLGFDPVPRFSASCGPLVGGPSPVGWPPTLTSEVRALSAKMAGAQVVPHEGISPSGFCRLEPGSAVAWRARVRRMLGRGSSNPPPLRALWRQWNRAQVVPPVGAWLPGSYPIGTLEGGFCVESERVPSCGGPFPSRPAVDVARAGGRKWDTKPAPNDEGSWLLPPW